MVVSFLSSLYISALRLPTAHSVFKTIKCTFCFILHYKTKIRLTSLNICKTLANVVLPLIYKLHLISVRDITDHCHLTLFKEYSLFNNSSKDFYNVFLRYDCHVCNCNLMFLNIIHSGNIIPHCIWSFSYVSLFVCNFFGKVSIFHKCVCRYKINFYPLLFYMMILYPHVVYVCRKVMICCIIV